MTLSLAKDSTYLGCFIGIRLQRIEHRGLQLLEHLIGRRNNRPDDQHKQMIIMSQWLCLLISNTSLVGVITVLTINKNK